MLDVSGAPIETKINATRNKSVNRSAQNSPAKVDTFPFAPGYLKRYPPPLGSMPKLQFTTRQLLILAAVVACLIVFLRAVNDALRYGPPPATQWAIEETRCRIHLFAKDNQRLPTQLAELPRRSGFPNRITDIWGNELVYEVDADGTIALGSYGKDGKAGGNGANADKILQYPTRDASGQFIADEPVFVGDIPNQFKLGG